MATPLIPLSVIWFVAVILLGLTIGLFTAGASTMEWYFEDESKAEQIEQGSEKEEKTEEKKDDEEKKKEKEESGKIMMMSVTDTETGNVIEKFKITFSAGQKAILMTLIIALFVAELRLYRWIISSQESETIIVGGAVAVSTRLMAFSLVSGTMMFFIGVRYLPRTRHVEI
ncbi:hypothetical protein BGZ76_004290 [Entomortierella beljakovae]|nr:hypothetical protein BGZ76_004290 [Entomortierella beljakovae]